MFLLTLLTASVLSSPSLGDQRIVESPSSSQVLRGGNVILRCAVDGQEGAVQWTQNGFGLGIDRQLAMFRRYAMVGASNEYNLNISSVTLADDGEYRCQLMATSSQPAKLSSPATLSVLVAPTPPRLTPVSPIGVIEAKAQTMTCVVDESRPPPRIEWLVANDAQGRQLVRSLGTTNVTRDNASVTVATRSTVDTTTSESSGVYTSVSRLDYVPMAGDDQAYVVCRVSHSALQRAYVEAVRVDVQYAPIVRVSVAPQPDYSSSSTIRAGGKVLLRCDVDAKPSVNVKRRWYRDGRPISIEDDVDERTNTLELPLVARDFDGTAFACEAHNVIGRGRHSLRLNVEYAPSITFHSPRQTTVEGGRLMLECHTSSNPPAIVSWARVDSHGDVGRVLHTGVNYTISNVRRHQQGTYECTATARSSTSPPLPSARARVKVLINGPPTIRALRSVARRHENARVQCEIYGLPFATEVVWSRGGVVLDVYETKGRYSEEATTNEDTVVTTLHVADVDDGDFGEYNCSAKNQYGTDTVTVRLEKTGVLAMQQALPIAIVALFTVCLLLACCCLCRRCCCRSASMSKTTTHNDVTVKVETLDGRSYPDMYGTTPIDSAHVTYGKDYMAVPQDNPDLDLLPPPYAHYTHVGADGVVYTNSLQRVSPSQHHHTNGGLVSMTYLDDGQYSPPLRSASTSVVTPLVYAVRGHSIPRVPLAEQAALDYQPLMTQYNPYGVLSTPTTQHYGPMTTVTETAHSPDTDNTTAAMSGDNSDGQSSPPRRNVIGTNV